MKKEEADMSMPRRVVQYTTGGEKLRTFESIKEAQNYLGITHISSVCRKRRITDGGYRWFYAEEEPGKTEPPKKWE